MHAFHNQEFPASMFPYKSHHLSRYIWGLGRLSSVIFKKNCHDTLSMTSVMTRHSWKKVTLLERLGLAGVRKGGYRMYTSVKERLVEHCFDIFSTRCLFTFVKNSKQTAWPISPLDYKEEGFWETDCCIECQ